jgi:hypothetical protein
MRITYELYINFILNTYIFHVIHLLFTLYSDKRYLFMIALQRALLRQVTSCPNAQLKSVSRASLLNGTCCIATERSYYYQLFFLTFYSCNYFWI